jgi:hypothetical protein
MTPSSLRVRTTSADCIKQPRADIALASHLNCQDALESQAVKGLRRLSLLCWRDCNKSAASALMLRLFGSILSMA